MTKKIKYSCGKASGKVACEVDTVSRVFITQQKGVKLYISMDTGNVIKEEITK